MYLVDVILDSQMSVKVIPSLPEDSDCRDWLVWPLSCLREPLSNST
jgi:hypothetical protein